MLPIGWLYAGTHLAESMVFLMRYGGPMLADAPFRMSGGGKGLLQSYSNPASCDVRRPPEIKGRVIRPSAKWHMRNADGPKGIEPYGG